MDENIHLTESEIQKLNQQLDQIELSPKSKEMKRVLHKNASSACSIGVYDPDHLQNYLVDQANNTKDIEDLVPYKSGVKRGKVFSRNKSEMSSQRSQSGVSDLMDSSICLDPDLLDALNNVDEEDLDMMNSLKGLLGMDVAQDPDQNDEYGTSDPNTGQITKTRSSSLSTSSNTIFQTAGRRFSKAALEENGVKIMATGSNFVGRKSHSALKKAATVLGNIAEFSENSNDNSESNHQAEVQLDDEIDEAEIQKIISDLKANDKNLTEINLNYKNISIQNLKNLGEALKNNTNLKILSLVATKSNNLVAKSIAIGLENNNTLKELNLETNYLTSKGVLEILSCLNDTQNSSLQILKVDNQKCVFGAGGEDKIAKKLVENFSILKFSYKFEAMGARERAVKAVQRNYDEARKDRRNSIF